jgi:hypothetical protein
MHLKIYEPILDVKIIFLAINNTSKQILMNNPFKVTTDLVYTHSIM